MLLERGGGILALQGGERGELSKTSQFFEKHNVTSLDYEKTSLLPSISELEIKEIS